MTDSTRLWQEPDDADEPATGSFLEVVDVVEPNFFQVIKLPFVSGNAAEVFKNPESVVLSESAARKYFGNSDPIGKTLTDAKGRCPLADVACRDSTVPLTVTGVLRDLPHTTHLSGEVFIPNTSIADYNSDEQAARLVQQ